MLNRSKLLQEIDKCSNFLFPDSSSKKLLALDIWNKILKDSAFLKFAINTSATPGWHGNLDDLFTIKNNLERYAVLAIDGSQIYPDRNMPGSNIFLINLGGTLLQYQKTSSVKFFCEPFLFMPDDLNYKEFPFSKDIVDLKREELEFDYTLKMAQEHKFNNTKNLCLIDGSLIFWHLESKLPEIKNLFLNVYLNYLNKFYENQILIAGYISLPKSREIISLIKLGLCRNDITRCINEHRNISTAPCKQLDNLIDTQILKSLLEPAQRTTIFWSNSKISSLYPAYLKPHFFYINTGKELARIEIPAWIAENNILVEQICKIILNQSLKGYGYPVALAEAHEQAVIKSIDRDFFYNIIMKIGMNSNKKFHHSQKSIKKRGISI